MTGPTARAHTAAVSSLSPAAARHGPGRQFACAVLLVGLTFVAYAPALDGGFVWDDDDYVENNPTLRELAGLRDMWFNPRSLPQYYPLVHTTFWIEYQISGLAPQTFHLTNVVLHAVNALLLWRILHRLAVPGAWCAAMLFALHPVHVESVAWITERKNVLSGTFYLSAVLAFFNYHRAFHGSGRLAWLHYGIALLLCAAALLSKTVTATLPAALLVVVWWKQGRLTRSDILAVLPMFAMALPLSLYTVWLEQYHVGARGIHWQLSLVERCLVAARACWFYLQKLLFPRELTFIYPRWQISASAPWQYLFPIATVALLYTLWVLRRRTGRGPLAAVLFFGGTLLPVLGVFNVYPMRYSYVADHFQYLASVGILALVAAGSVTALRLEPRRKWMPVLAAGVFLGLGICTWSQCCVYANREVLWLDTIRKNPGAEIAYTNLGMYYFGNGQYQEALACFRRAQELAADDPVTNNNLGISLGRLGQSAAAIERLRAAVRLDPGYADAYNNLGALLTEDGDIEEAVACLREAIRLRGEVAEFHYNLARALRRQGKHAEADQSLETARRLSGGSETWNPMGGTGI